MGTILEQDGGVAMRRDGNADYASGAVTINASASELHQRLSDLSLLSALFPAIDQVTPVDRARAKVLSVRGNDDVIAWDLVTLDDRPGAHLAWTAADDAPVTFTGEVEFEERGPARGTIVRMRLRHSRELGPRQGALESLFGALERNVVVDALRRFQALVEAGEIPTTQRQSRGERSLLGRTLSPTS
ncbi:MAG: SRPBCC family protein [Gemmatimonadaceae bacterium]|nr:SRPBCC family protein [Gemmatimonadaceae bacterium]